MIVQRHWKWIVPTLLLMALSLPVATWAQGVRGGFREAFGPRYDAAPPHQQAPRRHPQPGGTDATRRIRYWNEILLTANALDHTPVATGENRVFGEQLGPGRTGRAFAIVHIAIFDAVNAIAGGYRSYTGLPPAPAGTSMDAAIAQAARDTLVALYPSQAGSFDAQLRDDLARIRDGRTKTDGIDLGRRAAAAILALRANDGSQRVEPSVGVDFIPSNEPGKWRQDPISRIPLALGAYWGDVKPFVLPSAAQFGPPPPPALTSPEYTSAFNEVKRLGGDGVVTPTARTAEQTVMGIYWGYDGTPGLGTPPRLYNQIAVQIAAERGSPEQETSARDEERASRAVELARLLALVNVAMADAGMAIWEPKYHYQFWRPVTAIREADPGTGPTGAGDGNPATVGDPTFTPLGAPASNLIGPNFTPPFPAYTSGHAGFGGALFQTLRNFYRTDGIGFTFVSDEFNGVTRDNQGNVRPRLPRSFASLSQAEEENAQSRIYLGIHWAFDKTEGISQGRRVADHVFTNAFVPMPPASSR
jgi:PAP2 superfamily